MDIRKNFSLKNHHTFGIDVKTQYFVEIFTETELSEIIKSEELKRLPILILGGGSNILFTKDFEGLVIKNSIPGIKIIKETDEFAFVEAGAGVIWHEFVLYCIERNFGGIENLSLIPGTVGAAPMQNIGAYGQEIKDVFYSLKGIYSDSGEKTEFLSQECKFGYRTSVFKNELKNKFIITYVTFKLSKKPELNLDYGAVKAELEKQNITEVTIKDVSNVICRIRENKLPNPKEIGNAGSFFKNPEIDEEHFLRLKEKYINIVGYKLGNGKVKIAAGWLIEQTGWKGKKIGNTGAHEHQALVLVNYGNAAGEEIVKLAEEIKKSVKDKFDIILHEEVNII